MPLKTVLITGSSSGIGKAAVREFQASGAWNVVATMRDPSQENELNKLENVTLLPLDVTDEATVEDAVAETIRRFGAIDAVVNNAGYGLAGPFEASTEPQIERQFQTNVFGSMRVIRAVLPHMRERRSGAIVNVASIGGRMTFPLFSLYHGTKWAIEGFSESLQYELEPFGIRVKIVEPGPIKTDFYSRSLEVPRKAGLTAYDEFAARAMRNMNRSGETGASPSATAKVIYAAATDGSKRLRYASNAKGLLALRRLLPDGAFMAVIKRALLK
jgi:NAD(P)-dependent dehydrogenase (short-subunit alcohol dehydrogenase family)